LGSAILTGGGLAGFTSDTASLTGRCGSGGAHQLVSGGIARGSGSLVGRVGGLVVPIIWPMMPVVKGPGILVAG